MPPNLAADTIRLHEFPKIDIRGYTSRQMGA
jgi:hypothetical protein